MANIHIENSYSTWLPSTMKSIIRKKCFDKYDLSNAEAVLNRTFRSMYIEWWLHNIGYYITKPFCHIEAVKKINLRCKDVDLEGWVDARKD